jgi:hypothetical protein
MSASTCPGPSEGSCSTSPTSSSAAPSGQGAQQSPHQLCVDQRSFVDDEQIALERRRIIEWPGTVSGRVARDFDPQHAEPVLGVVEGDALDKTGQDLGWRARCSWLHDLRYDAQEDLDMLPRSSVF